MTEEELLKVGFEPVIFPFTTKRNFFRLKLGNGLSIHVHFFLSCDRCVVTLDDDESSIILKDCDLDKIVKLKDILK